MVCSRKLPRIVRGLKDKQRQEVNARGPLQMLHSISWHQAVTWISKQEKKACQPTTIKQEKKTCQPTMDLEEELSIRRVVLS